MYELFFAFASQNIAIQELTLNFSSFEFEVFLTFIMNLNNL